MPNPRTAAEWARTCTHFGPLAGIGGPVALLCVDCADAYTRQQVEAFRERARNTVEECGAVGDHDDDYYHGYDQAIQDAGAAIATLREGRDG